MAVAGQNIGLQNPGNPVGPTLPFNFSNYPLSNVFDLVAGAAILIPPGTWQIYSTFSVVQWLDPVSGQWLMYGNQTLTHTVIVNSDGANFRLWNPKGFPVAGAVTAAGTGYVQASTTVTVSGVTGSVWHAIVGGALGTFTVGNDAKGNAGGTNFTCVPTVVIGPPPTSIVGLPSTATALGGIQATATATLSGGAVNAVSIDIAGAGYTSPPTVQIIPNPFDVNIGIITVPTVTVALTGAGTVTAVVMDNFGTTAGAAPTLTINGAGSSATATATIVATGATDTIYMQLINSSP